MTRDEAKRRNLAARAWAHREPEIALAAVRAHPAIVLWVDPATQTPDERIATDALLSADTAALLAPFPAAEFPTVPAEVFAQGADHAHERVRHALLSWAGSTAVNPDKLSVLADAHATVREPDRRAVRMLPRFGRLGAGDVAMLPRFEVGLPAVKDAMLPGFEGVSASVSSWLLAVFDAAGGLSEARGKGAPWGLRLFVGSLLSLPLEFRDGRSQSMRLDTGTLASWLQPAGWNRRAGDFERMRQALRDLDRLRVPVAGGLLRVVDCQVLPVAFDRGRGPVVLRVAIPGRAARGASVDWELLRKYGAESAPLYRCLLSVAAVLDYAARAGRALTQTIPAPVLDMRGQPKRGKGGKVVRSAVERVPNPAARFAGWLTDDDVRRMVGLHADTRTNRKRAREALDRLADDGVVVLDRRRDGTVRLFGPGDEKRVNRVTESAPAG